jgi:hypothetical protein
MKKNYLGKSVKRILENHPGVIVLAISSDNFHVVHWDEQDRHHDELVHSFQADGLQGTNLKVNLF